jgi:hypothetical protein
LVVLVTPLVLIILFFLVVLVVPVVLMVVTIFVVIIGIVVTIPTVVGTRINTANVLCVIMGKPSCECKARQ